MSVSVAIAMFIGFIVGVLVCRLWRRVSCTNCYDKDFSIKKLEQKNSVLQHKIAMMNAHRVRQVKKKLERLRSKKKG